jgi:hypothetical protein
MAGIITGGVSSSAKASGTPVALSILRWISECAMPGLPDEQITGMAVQSRSLKYIPSGLPQIKSITRAVSFHRGAYRDRHGRWERDAMDADVLRTNSA